MASPAYDLGVNSHSGSASLISGQTTSHKLVEADSVHTAKVPSREDLVRMST